MRRGYIRNKIGSRIEGIRNRSRQDPTMDGASGHSAPTFSQLQRTTSSEGGFLLVDQVEASLPVDEEEEEEEEEDGGHHASLEQREDPLSDIDRELEALVLPDGEGEEERDGEQPCPKAAWDGGGGGGVKESEDVKSKPWKRGSVEVYEEQLELLQNHLTTAMIDNQNLQEEITALKKAKEEATTLRKENAILSRRLQLSSEDSPSASAPSRGGGAGIEAASPKLKLADKSKKGSPTSTAETRERSGSYGGSVLTVSTSEDGFETVSMLPDVRVARQREQQRARKKSRWTSFIEWCYDFISDFTQEQSSPDDEEPEAPLSAKKLKDNLQRLSRTSRPWQDFGHFLQGILQWKSIAESLVVFLIYMYCVWQGWIICMLAFIAILTLTLSYLRTSGLAEQFGFQPRPRVPERVDELGLGDKLQLMKKVGQTCQNKAELVSDSLEKAQNLFLWHQPEATRKIYINLCVFFVASVFLPSSYVLTAIGLFIGVKLFIIDNIYRKYPKVKEKYDGIARMWKSLPTDAELLQRQSLTAEQLESPASNSNAEDGTSVTHRRSEEEIAFCSRFQLPPDELPLPSWQTGKRCSVMDRDRPLTLTRSGRLYLTQSHLCFERQNRLHRDPDRFVLSLLDVRNVVKAKPFAVLPGSGMSVEVTLKTGVKHLFSAILNRDQAYQSILDQGMILGLPWGTDIHTEVRRRGARVRSDRGSSPGLSDSSRSLSTEEGERASLTRED